MELASGLFFAFALLLFGSMLLMLTFGYKKIELERRDQLKNEKHAFKREKETFWGLGMSRETAQISSDDVARNIEKHLQIEQSIANRFLKHPSADNLHDLKDISGDDVIINLEKYLHREQSVVDRFLAQPSTESLYEEVYEEKLVS